MLFINIIYSNLTGLKNFDKSYEIKNQFNKNYGCFDGDRTKAVIFDKKELNKLNNIRIHYKLDFLLFLKSFEFIAGKLYPELNLEKSVEMFFKNVKNINKFFCEAFRQNSQQFSDKII